jgi:hypothetical protein
VRTKNSQIKIFCILSGILAVFACTLYGQSRSTQKHSRGLLHQNVYNTGELGRAYDRGDAGMQDGFSSMEWPPNSKMFINGKEYKGYHNSFGGGLYLSGFKNGTVLTAACGAVTTAGNGQAVSVAGVYVDPGSITRRENYPLLPNGELNPAYDPNEAEEIITATWRTRTLKTEVTRTSRAWSLPGYNSFIIYEYDIVNIDTVDYTDAFVGWGYGFGASMFGIERTYNRWAEGELRRKDQFARFDPSRWMSYNHDRNGKPDSLFFSIWSKPGDRGGLNSPQAVGILPLHIDYANLAVKGQTNYPKGSDSNYVWDANNKLKQPYTNRYENANIDIAKIQSWLDITTRKTSPFNGTNDSTGFVTKYQNPSQWSYWKGRSKPSWTLGWAQPAAHGYVFGPYKLPKNVHLKFALAEVVGYGPGIESDSVYKDLGGGSGTESTLGFHPVPSWYKEMTYPDMGAVPPVIGSTYLKNNPLPWYVSPGVVSIRDVADRAIQMYTGNPLVKWDSLQFEPTTTPATGVYNTVPVEIPAPVFTVENTNAAVNKIVWKPSVESFSSARLKAPFSHYMAYRALSALGPWTKIDSVAKRDVRYFRDSVYVLYDRESNIGEDVYYIIYSVDSAGTRSGITNLRGHTTQAPAALSLGKVYVVPNPLIVTNGIRSGSSLNGDFTDRIAFYGLTKKCTIRVFSYSGQLVRTFEHDTPDTEGYSHEWFQLTRNNQRLASGIYFFTVDDAATGKRSTGKFVIIH